MDKLRLRGISKKFGNLTVVDKLNLTLRSGEFVSLLGPSGCGKTTTLRMIAGFERPTEGQVVLDGVDVATTPPHKRNVNTVFQNYALFPISAWRRTSRSGCATRRPRRRRAPASSAERWNSSGCPATRNAGRASSRAGNSSVWRSRVP